MSLSRSLFCSPACQRRLQRCIEPGMGLALRQAPLANWKKSVQGFALRSMSVSSTPCCCPLGAGAVAFWLWPAQAASVAAISERGAECLIWGGLRPERRRISSHFGCVEAFVLLNAIHDLPDTQAALRQASEAIRVALSRSQGGPGVLVPGRSRRTSKNPRRAS